MIKPLAIIVAIVCIMLLISNGEIRPANADTIAQYRSDKAQITSWLLKLQYTNPALPSYGAIRVHHTPGATSQQGKQFFRVSPYIGNLAVAGLLSAAAARHAGPDSPELKFAALWFDWYFKHLNPEHGPDGVPFEHFYLADGTGETTCVRPDDPRMCHYNDATDSAAATFFVALHAYLNAGGTSAQVTTPARRLAINRLAATMLALKQPDGLYWAKADYRARFLEDNCEVFAGLKALAEMEKVSFDDFVAAARYQMEADGLRRAITVNLWDSKSQYWLVAKDELGQSKSVNLGVWYPDMQAQLWPVLFSVVAAQDAAANESSKALDVKFGVGSVTDWAAMPDKVNGGFINSDVALAALMLGKTDRLGTYLRSVEKLKLKPASGEPFGWPFTASDAGWLLQVLVRLERR